jgi:hypothetical protein
MAFDEAKVKLIIEASTEAAAKKMREFSSNADQGLKNADVSARKFGDGMKQGWANAKAAWVEIGAAVVAVKKAYDLMNNAAQFQQRETAFRNMAASHGADADKIIADMKKLSAGTIDTMTIMEKAGTAMTLGIQADKLAELMEVARASSKITGQTVSQAYSDITLAVGRGSKMILDNLGIIVKVEDANEKYAQQLGKTSASLTEAEKKQAFLNATLEAGKDIVERVGDSQDSAAEKIQRYQARWKDAMVVVGKVLLNIAQGIELVFAAAGATVNKLIADIARMLSYLHIAPKFFKEIEENSRAAADKGIAHMSETWDLMTSMWKKEEPVRQKVVKDIEDQGEAAKKTGDEVKKLMDMQKSDAETRAAAIEEMYNEMGLGAEAHYREELNTLTKKAKDWQDAGVSIADTNKYMYEKINALQEQALEKGEHAQADWLNTMKWHTESMVNDLRAKEAETAGEIEKIAAKIDGLNGSEIAIDVRLFDNGATNALEAIENKLKTLGVINNINVSSGAVSRLDDLQARIDGIHGADVAFDVTAETDAALGKISEVETRVNEIRGRGADVAFDVTAETDVALGKISEVETRVNEIRGRGAEIAVNVTDNTTDAVSRLDDLQARIDGIHGADIDVSVTAETDAALGKISEVETRVNEIRGRGAEIAVNVTDNTADAVSRLNDLQARINGIHGADVAFDVTAETDVALGKISEVETRVNEIRGRGAEIAVNITDNTTDAISRLNDLQAKIDGIHGADVAFDVTAETDAALGKISEVATMQERAAAQTDNYTASLINNMQTREAQLSLMFGGISAGVAQLNANPINIQARLSDNGLTSGLDRIISKLQTVIRLTASAGMGEGLSSSSINTAGIEAQIAKSIKYGESAMVSAF